MTVQFPGAYHGPSEWFAAQPYFQCVRYSSTLRGNIFLACSSWDDYCAKQSPSMSTAQCVLNSQHVEHGPALSGDVSQRVFTRRKMHSFQSSPVHALWSLLFIPWSSSHGPAVGSLGVNNIIMAIGSISSEDRLYRQQSGQSTRRHPECLVCSSGSTAKIVAIVLGITRLHTTCCRWPSGVQ